MKPCLPRDDRHAFTVVEVLVVIAIIAILSGLVLSALGRARERARVVQCASNLKQLGAALHAFQGSRRAFPAADSARRPSDHLSVHFQLLDYLDEQAAAKKVRDEMPNIVDWNWPTPPIPISYFRCPADRLRPGANNYRVNLGSGPYFWPPYPNLIGTYPDGGNGAFTILRGLGGGDVKDGLSHTAAMSEKLIGDENDNGFDPERDYWFAGIAGPSYPPTDQLASACENAGAANPPHASFGGTSWLYAGFWTTWYNHVRTPNSKNWQCTTAAVTEAHIRHAADQGPFTASSNHIAGVNLLMMGGETRFISNKIDLTVWRALATRAGGETIGDDQF